MVSTQVDYDAFCKEALKQIQLDEEQIQERGSVMWTEYDIKERFPDFDSGYTRLRMLLKSAHEHGMKCTFRIVDGENFLTAPIYVSFDRV